EVGVVSAEPVLADRTPGKDRGERLRAGGARPRSSSHSNPPGGCSYLHYRRLDESPVKFAILEKNGYVGSSVTCPECQQAAPFHGHRPFQPVSLLGPITCRRAYYYCGRCGLGLFPFDEQAGFNAHRLTAGAERVVSLLGQVCDSF